VSSRRITIITTQLLGFDQPGGVGAATAYLAIALARMRHDVDILYTQEQVRQPLDGEWARRYEEVGATIRRLPALDRPVQPQYFARLRAVELALRADPPDVVIAHEYGAPAYFALRLRQLGLAFRDTLFVVYCHGTGRWVKDVTGNPRMSAEAISHVRLEQMGVELADIVVSPSAYMVDWMRGQGWQLPPVRVVPLVTRATAQGEPPRAQPDADGDRPVERLVFFGRLLTVKGVETFARALNALAPELLEGTEVEFLGGPSKDWDPGRVAALMSERTTRALRSVSFETELGPQEALARLSRPGTLAVMPSLADNSPNVVYECLEARIPFLASAAGGIGELVAPEDRARVLFPPTIEGVSDALRRALADREALRPVRPAFEGSDVLRAWRDVLATETGSVAREFERPTVDVVVVERGRADLCLSALNAQSYEKLNVIRAATRAEGLLAGTAEWVIFLDGTDLPRPDFVEVLVQAQAASGADAVSCAVVQDGREHFFAGEPGGAGVLWNGYGTAALLRRSLLGDLQTAWPVVGDPDWPLLARLNADGASVVSVPMPLLTRAAPPGTLENEPSDALLVIEALERALPHQLRLLARLAAALAAESRRLPPTPPKQGLRRLRSLVRRFSVRGEARGDTRRPPQRAG
jgi:glycosyltransferase involved in cell wall biosynthesis